MLCSSTVMLPVQYLAPVVGCPCHVDAPSYCILFLSRPRPGGFNETQGKMCVFSQYVLGFLVEPVLQRFGTNRSR